MGETIRFGVSLDSDLLDQFDTLCLHHGYQNRSEALRDLIRKSLVEQEWRKSEEAVVATLTLVYDHHKSDLAQKMTSQQHDAHHIIIASLHIHLDHDNCLEVLILQGNGVEVKDLSQKLIATKGVKYGNLSHATTGKNLS